MRKSIFLTTILALFSLFIGLEQASAQVTPDENNPVLGVDYTYSVTVGDNQSEYDGNGGKFHWFITQDGTNLLDLSKKTSETNDFFSVKSGTGFAAYDNANDTNSSIKLNWKELALSQANPFFLVLKYSETPAGGTCEINNIKVMKIEPLNTFELDIVPVQDENGQAFANPSDADVCAAGVESAVYDAAANSNKGGVKVTYKDQTLYYKITAKGFLGKWKPQIKLPELAGREGGTNDANRVYKSIQWKEVSGTAWKDFKGFTADGVTKKYSSKDGDFATIANKDTGSAIIVKVVIKTNQYEGLTKEEFALGADGLIKDTDKSDIIGGAGSNKYEQNGEYADTANIDILARPKIQAQSGAFLQEIK